MAQFIWQGQGTLNGTVAGDLFILEQPFNSDEVIPGPAAGTWRWSSSTGSRPATITVAGSDLLTVIENLSIVVDSRSDRLTAVSGLGIGYFGSLGGYDLKSTRAPVSLGTDPFGLRSLKTDQGTFVGFDRGTTTFGVGVADSVDGDYSGNGLIDAADYTVWRDSLGADTLPNRSPLISGEVGQEDFDFWKAQFAGSGSSLSVAPVPEPNAFLLMAAIAISAFAFRRR